MIQVERIFAIFSSVFKITQKNSVFDDDRVVVNQNKWRARAFFGLRL